MKKPFRTLLLLALGFAPGLASAATISLSGTGGAVVSVTVSVAGIEALAEPSLGAFDLDLGYDPGVLAFSDVEFGTWPGTRIARIDRSQTNGVSVQLVQRLPDVL